MAKQVGRPKRQKKADRLLHSGQSQNQVMCDFALAPLDRLAIEMDRKWGIDVLPELVSVEMAQKYGSAMAKLNAAMKEKNDLNDQAMQDADKIAELRDTIARMAKAMGAKSASGV